MLRIRSFVLPCSLLLLLFTRLSAEEKKPAPVPGVVSYFKDVRPIFQAHCHGCHQNAKRGGEYVMTDVASLLAAGESGEKGIVAGKPEASHVLRQVTPKDGKAEMPKGKPPLSEVEIESIRKWIAAGANDDSPAATKPAYDAEHPPVYSHAPVVSALAFSPDGKLLAVSGYHEVLLHNAEGAELIGRMVGLSERIESLAFSPDGKQLAVAGGSPGRLGELQIWDVAERKLKLSVPVTFDTLYGAAWSPDGKSVSFGCTDKTVRGIDASNGKEILFNQSHEDWVLDTVWSVDGKHVISVSRDRSVRLVEVETQRFIDNITSITPGALKGGLQAIDRHPKKPEVLIGGADGTPKIYKIFRDKARVIGDDFNFVRKFETLPGRLFCVSYSADGTRVAAGSSNQGTGHVAIYQEADAKTIGKLELKDEGIFALAFSPDGKTLAVAGFEGHVRLLNADNGEVKKTFLPAPLANASVAK